MRLCGGLLPPPVSPGLSFPPLNAPECLLAFLESVMTWVAGGEVGYQTNDSFFLFLSLFGFPTRD